MLILTPYYPPAELAGGPARTLEAMVAGASPATRAAVLTSAHDLGQDHLMDVVPDRWLDQDGVRVRYTRGGSLRQLLAIARTRPLRPGIIYLNSLFHPTYSVAPVLMHRLRWWGGAQLVIAPRGELDPGALRLKRWKKQAFLRVTRVLGAHRDVLWHASTPTEGTHIGAQFPGSRTFVRENEILRGSPPPPPPAGDERRIVFLSRISRKKGLHVLLRALAAVTTPVALDILGNEEDVEYAEECRRLADALPAHVRASFHGPLKHREVVATLARYDLLALPTAGENFGHAIAEALSAGCPAMLGPVTPWTDAARATATLVPDLEPNTWARALDHYLNQPTASISQAKQVAHALYISWDASARTQPSTLDYLAAIASDPTEVASARTGRKRG